MYLICGEALYDFFLKEAHAPGALSFEARSGGSPFNVAIGIARRGGKSALLTGLSNDPLGTRLHTLLTEEGVETGYLIRSGRRTTVSLVDLSPDGQPAYAFYGVGSADTALSREEIPAIGPEIYGLHFGSYSIAVTPVADAFMALAERESGRLISLDPNVRPTIEPDLDIWRGRIDRLLAYTDMVKTSTEDLEVLYPGVAPADIAERWLAKGPKLVVVTDGGAAVTAFTGTDKIAVNPPVSQVVDTVGAGDSFQATLLAELAKDGDPKAALATLDAAKIETLVTAAAAVAAATCARRGADIPRLGEPL